MTVVLFSLLLLAIVLGVAGLTTWLIRLDTNLDIAMPSMCCVFAPAGSIGGATPNCKCQYCQAVYDEWGRNALGFQKIFDSGTLDRFLGIERIRKAA